jgi:hypothetical protein
MERYVYYRVLVGLERLSSDLSDIATIISDIYASRVDTDANTRILLLDSLEIYHRNNSNVTELINLYESLVSTQSSTDNIESGDTDIPNDTRANDMRMHLTRHKYTKCSYDQMWNDMLHKLIVLNIGLSIVKK